MSNVYPLLPRLTVNGAFIDDFLAAPAPCCALGLVEERKRTCGFLAIRTNEIIPPNVTRTGFNFGQKPCRKRYASGQERRGSIKNRVSIDERPEIVEQKVRLGDWEGDTVIGKNHQGVLVTLAERKSRYVLAGALPSKHADGVTAKVNNLLRPHPGKCHTVTFDNGKEFAGHEAIAAELNADIYFAHPYHSWERGLNENSNGLLRQYFPKGMELTDVTDEQVQQAVDRLNHRPRKVLGFRTPHEVFFGTEMRYTNTPLKVALRT